MRLHPIFSARLALLACSAPLLIGSVGLRTNLDDRLLAAHNRERSEMGVPPLQWDPQLAANAAQWADHLSRNGKFEHSPDDPEEEPEGENIWGGSPGYYAPESMVALWVSEKRHFTSGTFPKNSQTGHVQDVSHYTQLIWKKTTHVGCSVSDSGREEILVCRYRTAGNVYGEDVI